MHMGFGGKDVGWADWRLLGVRGVDWALQMHANDRRSVIAASEGSAGQGRPKIVLCGATAELRATCLLGFGLPRLLTCGL